MDWFSICIFIWSIISSTYSMPQVSEPISLVVSSTEPSKEQGVEPKEQGSILPKIYEMRVDSNVSNRYAQTLVTSKVRNLAKTAQEATFSIIIPDHAFISAFTMEIDGKSYKAYVQEKKQAEETYKNAVASGQGAAHIAVNARDSNLFTVSVNIEPQSKATFYLRYEELLQRHNEKYELLINIHPGQPVKNLDVEVHIDESRPLKFVKTPSLRSGNEISKNDDKLSPHSDINIINDTSAIVKFSPDINRQKELAKNLGTTEENGLSGQFVVQYDVERDPSGGEVLVNDGYFVHFFAPSELTALPKQVVFILDTSGSMSGIRVTQLKEAMKSILSELKKEDIFNIVEFGTIVKVWNIEKVEVQYESGNEDEYFFVTENPEATFKNKTEQPLPPAYKVSEENIKKAEKVVDKLNAYGGTDIQSAIKIGLELVANNLKTDKEHQPLIVFLTDGEPTVGEVDNRKIISIVTELNSNKIPIFSLSFGDGADKNFLEKISLKNSGFARHIYEGADASLQLQEFYKQISSPLLSKVTFKYTSNVSEVTQTTFPILFSGGELAVTGKIENDFSPGLVEGWGIKGPVNLIPIVKHSDGPLERLWAYLTLKQILEKKDTAENKSVPIQEALKIALTYSFVSDVSSLVVVKPNSSESVNTEDASNKNEGSYFLTAGLPLSINHGAYPAAMHQQIAFSVLSPDVDRVSILLEESALEEQNVISTYNNSETDILEKLPWLSPLLNVNGTITISSGTYKLGLNENVTDTAECHQTPRNTTGLCTLLKECPQIFVDLTDENVYKNYFCELNGYAGVCCPEEENNTN